MFDELSENVRGDEIATEYEEDIDTNVTTLKVWDLEMVSC